LERRRNRVSSERDAYIRGDILLKNDLTESEGPRPDDEFMRVFIVYSNAFN